MHTVALANSDGAAVVLMEWQADLSVPIGVVVLLGLYGYALKRLKPAAEQMPGWKAASFGLGALSILLALYSPLHDLSDHYLFSAHMVQHLLLIMAMPILLLLGTPRWMLSPLLRGPSRRLLGVLVLPPVAFVLFNGAFAGSHLPGFYDLTLREHGLHTLEHLVFMATAVLAWWPVMSPARELPPIPPPAQILYLFLHTFPMMMVGAIITDAPVPLYAPYASAARVWDISPLFDQQAGGLIMWIGGSMIYLLVLTIVFFRWAAREDAKEPGRGGGAGRAPTEKASPPRPLERPSR